MSPLFVSSSCAEETLAELARAASDPEAANRSRVSVLLANRACDQTLTITPSLWAMLGLLPVGAVQPRIVTSRCARPDHRLRARLLHPGRQGAGRGRPDRRPRPGRLEPASVFVTPPGEWHAHYNESGTEAYLLPIQDAGLQTYLRSLDIRFHTED